MKKLLYITCGLFLFLPIVAQNTYKGELKLSRYEINRVDNKLSIDFTISLDNIALSSNKIIQIVPVLIDEDGNKVFEMDTITVAGKTKAKYLKRAIALGNSNAPKNNMYIRQNGKKQRIDVYQLANISQNSNNLKLAVDETVSGCASCGVVKNRYILVSNIQNPLFLPQFQLSFISPKGGEQVVEKSEEYEAKLTFKVNRWDLLFDYANNAYELAKVDDIIKGFGKDKQRIAIQSITITGYASPEGYPEHNRRLSFNRAEVFANYLREKYNIDKKKIKVYGEGEDWEGLKKSIQASSMTNKKQLIDIINNSANVDTCIARLKELEGGAVYKKLLEEYFPALRRNKYSFTYVLRSYSIDEIREKLATDPKSLSLDEILTVAGSYNKQSAEAGEVYNIAASIYPTQLAPNLNASVYEIESRAFDKAIARLSKFKTAQALNNLGVAYIMKGEYELGEANLLKAVNEGLDEGKTNLERYNRWKAENNINK